LTGVDATVEITPLSMPGDTLIIIVEDADLAGAGTIEVDLIHDVTGEQENNVTLTETSPGVFEGTIATTYGTTAGTDNDGTFNTQNADTITVTYVDELTSTGGTAELTDIDEVVELPAESELVIIKTTPKRNVIVGELVPYKVSVTNLSDKHLYQATLVDLIPPGFGLVSASATINGLSQAPLRVGRRYEWDAIDIPPGGTMTATFLLVVGANVQEGLYVNTAFMAWQGRPITEEATATVRVIADHLFDCADVIGKVYEDRNKNGYQDEGEPGLPNVRIIAAEGIEIRTDPEGRYHVACAMIPDPQIGQNYILKLDTNSLPPGYGVTTENPRVIRLTRGKAGKLNFGVRPPTKVALNVTDSLFAPGSKELGRDGEDIVKGVVGAAHRYLVLTIVYHTDSQDSALKLQRVENLRLDCRCLR
jgi:uncharacterized repeat protein (TIGR01451 family)